MIREWQRRDGTGGGARGGPEVPPEDGSSCSTRASLQGTGKGDPTHGFSVSLTAVLQRVEDGGSQDGPFVEKISPPEDFGEANYTSVSDLRGDERTRALQARVSRIIAKLAEDKSGEDTIGDDFWDIEQIMSRKLTRRPLWHCKKGKEKERIVFIFDDSGSCNEQASLYQDILVECLLFDDVEVYSGPNGVIHEKHLKSGKVTRRTPGYDELPITKWPFRRRSIVFFGDYDAGRWIVKSSEENQVWFFNSETRYEEYESEFGKPLRMDNHPWNSARTDGFRDEDFTGRTFRCRDIADFLDAVKRLR